MADWRPGASRNLLETRAQLLSVIRDFFSRRGVLEVETPLLARAGVTDPHLQLLESSGRFLQTSPEYAMKRLLAAGCGSIFQTCKAFRQEEAGSRHNPEFSLLEWYRLGFSLQQMMEEVAQLIAAVLPSRPVSYHSYRDLFVNYVDIDPFAADIAVLTERVRAATELNFQPDNRDTLLDLLLTHVIEPQLPNPGIVFVYNYPASQAALAQLTADGEYTVGERFEVYVDGLELANGYRELTDAAEQAQRFARDNAALLERGQPVRAVDERLLEAMSQGLPDCSGVALGLDRLLMLSSGAKDIRQVLAFDWSRA